MTPKQYGKTLRLGAFCLAVVLGLLSAGGAVAGAADAGPALVPWPAQCTPGDGRLVFSAGARIVATRPELAPLAGLLAEEIFLLVGQRLETAADRARPGDVVLELADDLPHDAYTLDVADRAIVRGGSYHAVAAGTATLLQAIVADEGRAALPRLTVEDRPVASYRGLLIDVARRWHPIETLEQIVVLCRLYKINYLQLHLTDDQSFTFPSRAFPALPTKDRHYTLDELRELVRFADRRGVTLVPELEGPGHSGKLRALFGRPGTHVLNLASEEVYAGLDTLVGEMCGVFRSSPYFHIGADEAYLKGVGQSDEEKAFMAKHGLQGAAGLYCHYIVRMNEIVKKHGKQTIVWEGFHGSGGGGVTIPRDVVVIAWESRYNPPSNLAGLGYTLINAAWKPLYVVGSKRWPADYIYRDWNLRLWQHHIDRTNVQLDSGAAVLGAQMCAWEQSAGAELPSLRPRLPAMSERIWNPRAGRSYADFQRRRTACDALFGRLLGPVVVRAKGLIGPARDLTFNGPLTVTLAAAPHGTIRYTLDGGEPTLDSPVYTRPLKITGDDARPTGVAYYSGIKRHITSADMVTIRARLFAADGRPIGGVTQKQYTHVTPRALYRVYESQRLRAPQRSHYKQMPDTGRLEPIRSGWWPDLVAGLPMGNHPLLTVPMGSAIVSEGTIAVPAGGTYTFGFPRGEGRLLVAGNLVLDTVRDLNEPMALKQGRYPIRAEYFFSSPFAKGRQKLTFTARLDRSQDHVDPKEVFPPDGGREPRDVGELLVPLDE